MVGGVDALLVWVSVTNPGAAYISAAMATLGSVGGSLFLFMIARKGGEAYLAKYTASARGARLKSWFQEYGLLTVFVPAFVYIPMPLKLFVLSAGALGSHPALFTAVMLLARLLRYFSLAWLGLHLGNATLPYLQHHVLQAFAFAVALFIGLYLLVRYADRRRQLRSLNALESNSPESA